MFDCVLCFLEFGHEVAVTKHQNGSEPEEKHVAIRKQGFQSKGRLRLEILDFVQQLDTCRLQFRDFLALPRMDAVDVRLP